MQKAAIKMKRKTEENALKSICNQERLSGKKSESMKVFAGRVWETSFFQKAGFPGKEL
ncbi:MAG: hypothetical protein LWY06_03635 [Firmicutes bacterium]|nr:hypothetical protein [Bacillota bacterium]